MSRRTWALLGAAAVGAVVFSIWAGRPHGRKPAVVAGAVEATAEVAYQPRTSFPDEAREESQPAPRWPARAEVEHRQAEVVNGVLQLGPVRHALPQQPPPPREIAKSAVTWANDYSIAMCECRTRACASGLQGRFIRSMAGVAYDEQRDAAGYRQAMDRALQCYFSLPEGS
jgi:hypothetical protein